MTDKAQHSKPVLGAPVWVFYSSETLQHAIYLSEGMCGYSSFITQKWEVLICGSII